MTVNGRVVRDPAYPVQVSKDRIEIAGSVLRAAERVYIALNKPRGLLTTRSDEKGRATIYDCFAGHDLPYLAPVGRLDKASEGLLLLSNDSQWASAITEPMGQMSKTYHVQIDTIPERELIARMISGVQVDGVLYACSDVELLRQGRRNAWLSVQLQEGKNRHIRRLLEALGVSVLRLVRVAIGSLALGDLESSKWRHLSAAEVASLGEKSTSRK